MNKVMVIETPNCTWELDGEWFVCTHDEATILTYEEDHLGPDGHYQIKCYGYACAECGEPLEGSPEADRNDYLAEIELMEVLGK